MKTVQVGGRHLGTREQVRKFSPNPVETFEPFVDQSLFDPVQELGDGRKRDRGPRVVGVRAEDGVTSGFPVPKHPGHLKKLVVGHANGYLVKGGDVLMDHHVLRKLGHVQAPFLITIL